MLIFYINNKCHIDFHKKYGYKKIQKNNSLIILIITGKELNFMKSGIIYIAYCKCENKYYVGQT